MYLENWSFFVPWKAYIVTDSCALIPALFKTFVTVFSMILISVRNEMLSTYSRSNSNFSSQLMAFLPLHCAHPVNPGLTSCLMFLIFHLYKGRYLTRSGLGPTIDISPFKILKALVIHPDFVDLNSFPNFVSLISSGRRFPSSSFSSVIGALPASRLSCSM